MSDDRDHSGAITLPPVIFLAALLIGVILERVWPAPFVPPSARVPVGFTVLAVAVVLAGLTVPWFRRMNTSIHVHKPTTALITGGPYRFSRNPAYLALTLLYVGIAVLIDGLWTIALLLPALVALHYGVIAREERYLERKFGDQYRRYRARVRRWI